MAPDVSVREACLGSLENRVRFFRELIEDTKEAVGDSCAVAVRFAVDELLGSEGMQHDGEAKEIVSMLAELSDLWDVNISAWKNDSITSRFGKEGHQEKYISFVKQLTTKPVVGVGRYTSPNSMVSAIERGVMDFIGAARPSIADPFLPNKIKEGRHEDIRQCIGCNICVTGDTRFVPIRCTQNPTMGEEFRRDWHPEIIAPKKSEDEVLIVGAGPAGLEAARALGQRGYRVILTDAKREAGGRVLLESALPNLIEWRRVIDWRLTQIQKIENVFFYPSSKVSMQDALDAGAPHMVVATLWESLQYPTQTQLLGDLLSLTAGFLWAATSLYLKRVVRTSMTPSQMLFYQLGFSALQLTLMSLLFAPKLVTDLSAMVLASLAYQGIIVAFASYLVWFWLIQVYPVSDISGFTFFTPIFGILLGGVMLQELLTVKLLIGGGLVAGGMALVNWPERGRHNR